MDDGFNLRFSAAPPPESMVQLVAIPDGLELAEMLDVWARGVKVGIERGLLANFIRQNAWHLIAGKTIIYRLTYYYPADVDTLILDLVEKGYKATYQRIRSAAELTDVLFISMLRKDNEKPLPITELKHYGEE